MAWVRRLATRLVADVHRAEDVAQSALYEALRNPPPFANDRSRLRRWLGGIVRHEARNAVGREAERPWRERQAERRDAPGPTLEAESAETRDTLLAGLEQLPENDRQRLVWHYLDGQPVAVIAARENASPATTRKRLERARGRLRDWLDQRYGDRSTWCAALASLARSPGATGGLTAARVWGGLGLLLMASLVGWAALRFGGGTGRVVLALSPMGSASATPVAPTPMAPGALASEGVERSLAAAVSAEAARPTALVVAEDGSALAGATVVARDGAGATWTVFTGPDGYASLPEGAEAHWLAAGMPGRVASALSPGWWSRGTHLVLREAQPLGGQVRIAAGHPGTRASPQPTSLALTSYTDPLGPAPPWVANGLRRAGVPGRVPYSVSLGDDGDWSVDGIPHGWSGRLHAPDHTWFADLPAGVDRLRRNAVEVRGPRADLAFEVQGLPRAKGRIVNGLTGEPLFLAEVRLVPRVAGDTARRTFASQAQADGSFELSFGPGASELEAAWLADPQAMLERVELTFEHDGFVAHRQILEGAERWGPDAWVADLGVIELDPVPEFVAAVVARSGEPLAGALAMAGATTSRPAEKDGLVHVQAAGTGEAVWGAPGHRRRRWRVTRGPNARVERIALDPGGTVLLGFDAAGGVRPTELESLRVELHAHSLPFDGAAEGQGFPAPLGAPAQAGFRALEPGPGSALWGARLRLDSSGRARLDGLDPGVELELFVRDRFGRLLGQARGTTPHGPAPLELNVVHSGTLEALRLRVLDSAGVPIPQSSVHVYAGQLRQRFVTDRMGQLELASCAEDVPALRFDVAAAGFATRRFGGMVWRPGDGAMDLKLERARPLRVQLQLPAGESPEDLELFSELPGGLRLTGRPVEPGIYAFDTLAGGEIGLTLCRDGVQLSRLVPPGIQELTWVVPAVE